MKVNIPVCYRTRCEKCATKIEFQLNETHKIDYRGGRFITCPNCKNEITVLYGMLSYEEGTLSASVEAVYGEMEELE